MNSKYYTPEIEEFHVGFEFQHLNYEGRLISNDLNQKVEWHEEICDWEWLDMICDDFEHDKKEIRKYRVKYLDKEDIESLGWGDYIPPQEYNHVWKKGNFWISVWFNNEIPKVRITFNNLFFLFDGKIKNKSELKKLMQQLEIQ